MNKISQDREPSIVALLIIDMQQGTFEERPGQYDAKGVIDRINKLHRSTILAGGTVFLIQHDGPAGDTFAPETPGWRLIDELWTSDQDLLVRKTACDAFYRTRLEALLRLRGVEELIVTGTATDFCIDTTIRAAASREFDITVVVDAHTTANRSYMPAEQIIGHHQAVWLDLIAPECNLRLLRTEEVVTELGTGGWRSTADDRVLE